MKKHKFVRVLAMLLAVILCVSVIPQPASAGLLSQYQTISGSWSDTKFWRSNRYTYPYEFNKQLVGCTGFTLDYEIVEVSKGSLSGSNFKYEVYVRTSTGSWKSVKTFYMDDDMVTVNITFDDPLTIDAVAVICHKNANVSYTHAITVRNAKYKSTSSSSTSKSTSGSTATTTSGTRVSGSWSDTKFWRSNRSTVPFEFYSPINRCKSFTLNYTITEVSKGNLDGNFKFAVYVRTTSGNWKYVHEFTMDGYSTSTKVTLSDPVSIDAVAVFCLKNANMSYSYNFTITNPVTK